MSLEQTTRNWQRFGEQDPLWAVLTLDGKRGNRWDLEQFFATGRQTVDDLLAWARDAGATVDVDRALDFGCGVGRLTQALAEHFREVVGVDAAPSMVEQANRLNRHPQRCRFTVNQVDDLSLFSNESFDLVLSIIVLQHIEPSHTLKYLAEFLRVLRPGGVLLFQLTDSERRRMHFAAPTLKQRLLTAMPMTILNAYAHTKSAMKGLPNMLAWGIPSELVEAYLEQHGGRVLAVEPDDWGGPRWTSNHYCVVKSDRVACCADA